MSKILIDLDLCPYTGTKELKGKLRVPDKGERPWIDGYFDGRENYSQIKNITQGREYNVIRAKGYGDVQDITVINDVGEEQTLGDFFFEEVEVND